MTLYEVPHGVAAAVFLALFVIQLPFTVWALLRQGPHLVHLILFNLVRVGACITSIISATEDFSSASNINENVIIADIVLTTIGSFWLYALAVAVLYLCARDHDHDQTKIADLIHRLQNVLLLVMVALIIAAASIGSFPANSTTLGLRKAYSFIYLFSVLFVSGQYIRLWIKKRPTHDTMLIWASVALVIVFVKSIYILASSFATEIASYNYLISIGWFVGGNLLPDFLASALFTAGALLAPKRDKNARAPTTIHRSGLGEIRNLRMGIRNGIKNKVFGAGGNNGAQYGNDIQYR